MKNTGTIYFETPSQAALFSNELQGQISDGAWENAGPVDHWKFWCDLSVKVDDSNPRIVAEGYCPRNTYGINRKDLLEVVGSRMMSIAVVAKFLGNHWSDSTRYSLECLEDLFEWNWRTQKVETKKVDVIKTINNKINKYRTYSKDGSNDFWMSQIAALENVKNYISYDVNRFNEILESYNYKSLLKDLRAIKAVMKSRGRWS